MAMRARLRLLAMQSMTVGLGFLISFGLLEVALRSAPSLIGLPVLVGFEPQLRGRIAQRLDLPTMETVLKISPEMRSDGGPTIFLPGPGSLTVLYADAVDLALGAVEQVQVDQNGLCNDAATAQRPQVEVFMAGDSFVFCTGVAATQTAAHQLQEMSGLPTYNLGIRGTGPDEYLEMMKRHAPNFLPRIAVMNIYEGNDLRDVLRKLKFLTTGEDRRGDDDAGVAWSYAAQFVKSGVTLAVKEAKRRWFPVGKVDFRYAATVGGERMAMNVANRDKDEVDHARQLQAGEIGLDVFAAPLTAFLAWAQKTGIVPIVTYIPSMYTAYAATVEFEDPEVGAAVQAFSTAQRQWFATHAAAQSYQFLDFTPAFQQAAAEGVVTHFPANVHLTPQGHEVVARELHALLKGMGLTPTQR